MSTNAQSFCRRQGRNPSMQRSDDPYVPEQLWDRLRQVPTGPQRLMAAILEDAIHALRQTRVGFQRPYRRPRLTPREEAIRWITSPDRWWPYSFENICAQFGLEPDAVRTALLKEDR